MPGRLTAGAFQRVRWYCADPRTLRHVRAAVRAAGAAAVGVEVCPLPETIPVDGRRRGAA